MARVWVNMCCLVPPTEQYVSGMEIINGYNKSSSLFYKNGRVLKLRFEFSDGSYIDRDIGDDYSLQTISFGKVVCTSTIKISIQKYKSGNKYDDICISFINPY